MANRINKTSICSILFLDLIDYSKNPDSAQIEIKNQFNALISLSLGNVAKDDCILLDTGDGVAIVYMGSPEDLMFVALTIRDGILKANTHSQNLLFVRFGINLGPVRIVSDINGQPNIIGDGINVAQRIMSFSEPNQILVSRTFYEITSRLTVEFSEMFAYSGIKQDKHVRNHEVYSVRSHSNQLVTDYRPDAPKDQRRANDRVNVKNKSYWVYAISSLFIVVTIFEIVKFSSAPSKPIIDSSEVTPTNVLANLQSTDTLIKHDLIQKNVLQAKLAQDGLAKKEAESEKSTERLQTSVYNPKIITLKVKPVDYPDKIEKKASEKNKTNEKLFLKTVKYAAKQGQENKCSQGQIGLGQCN